MSSFIFEAHVRAIYSNLRNSLPKLQERFGDNITIEDVIDKIGTGKLMHESMNASLGASISSIRGENYSSHNGQWLNIIRMYEEALRKAKEPPPYLGEWI